MCKEVKSEKRFFLKPCGKIHEVGVFCPRCNSFHLVHNGNDKCKSKLIKELGLKIKKGKYKCKICSKTWTTHYEDSELFVNYYKQLIATTVFDLCTKDLSLDEISEHIELIFGKNISYEWVRQLYIKNARLVEQKKVLQTSGIFHYDEQYTKVNGKTYLRVVVIDAVKKKVIFDDTVEDSKIETLKDKLNLKMLPYNKEAFIVDLVSGYPKMLKDLYPEVRIQWCIFHLNKLIIKDFEDSKKLNKYGKKVLPLQELYNQYFVFNLFLDHGVECQFLKRQLKRLTKWREMLKGCNCYEDTKIIPWHEMRLISEFKEFRRSLKKYRRKHRGKYLLRKTKQETLDILERLEREISFFPKKVQGRIKKIREHLSKFTLFQENPLVPPTNNGIEQYYSATLQKTDKKKFRSKLGLDIKLKIVREKWNHTLERIKFDFLEFLQLFARLNFFFGPP